MATLSLKREQDIFNNNTLLRQERASVNYAIYFDEKPSFVTYYSQNMKTSMVESTLEDSNGLIGNDSGIRFNTIKDLPIYALSGVDGLSEDQGDFGLDTSVEGQAVIIPRLISPLEEDLFTIDHDTESHVFKVTKVEIDKITGENFYQITFKLHNININEIVDQLDIEFITDYDNIGTNYNAVIAVSDKNVITYMLNVHNIFLDFLEENFYHRGLGFMYVDDDPSIYDPMQTIFALNHGLYERLEMKRALSSIYVNKMHFRKAQYKLFYGKNYKNTIFYALENKNYSNLQYCDFFTMSDFADDNELSYEHDTYLLTQYSNDDVNQTLQNIFDSDLINRITTAGALYDDDVHIVEDMILRHMNGTLTNSNIMELLGKLDNIIDDDVKGFMLINVVLFLIKYTYNNLLIK